ncbi:MAG: ribonuclease domain-containing protein [Caldimonas sp.]
MAPAHARGPVPTDHAVQLVQLPADARAVHGAVRAGGPFAFTKDGVVFANRERLLPAEPRGFYREYTVAAVGARHRGARRIVCGGAVATRPQACWYTADHYNSFQRITP